MKSHSNLFVGLALVVGFLFLGACGSKVDNRVQNSRVNADVSRSDLTAEESKIFLNSKKETGDGCLEHLKSVACISDKAEMGYDPDCSSTGVTSDLFVNIGEFIQIIPPLHREILCHLDRLQIQPKIYSIGYATQIRDAAHRPIGSMIGIRPDVLKGTFQKDLWTWKEQLNFGLSKMNDPELQISPLGPFLAETVSNEKLSLLVGVLVHEISHLVDFLNNANSEDCTFEPTENSEVYKATCVAKDGSFSRLNWKSTYSFLTDGSQVTSPGLLVPSPWLEKLCYYDCTAFAAPADMDKVYGALGESDFMTGYSSVQWREDFAEASTAVLMKDQGYHYQVRTGDGRLLFDLNAHRKNPKRAKKARWILDFYARPDLRSHY